MISHNSSATDFDSPTHFQTIFRTNSMGAARQARSSSPEPMGLQAGNDIPGGRVINLGVTDLVIGHDLLDDKRSQRELTSSTDCYVKVYWKNGRLESGERESLPPSWLRLLRCARDRHEQNLELVRGQDGLCTCTMRQIKQGEELLVWYSEGLAREAGVPILTPCHIRGHQKYVCTGCQEEYTHPNTLKAHMFLHCRNSLVPPCSDEGALIPFHHLLQTLSRSLAGPPYGRDNDRKLLCKYRDTRLTLASSSRLLPGCSGCELQKDETAYRSAFRAPSSARDIKKETVTEDGLMTPDSSTDQSSALNLSVKLTEAGNPIEKLNKMSLNAVHQWDTLTAQRMMTQSLSVPVDYPHLSGCYHVSPPLHAFGIQFMNRDTSALPQSYQCEGAFGNSLCSTAEFSFISPHLMSSQERTEYSLFKPHTTSPTSSIRSARPSNHYGLTLPSDKEPLDLLPQAYFANKSKKGHLCLCCGKLYSRKYGLKIHMRTHNGYKPLKCKICSRPFGDPSNLNKHVRLHAQGETPYRCDYCGKVLVRRRDLERHVRSRHPIECVQNDDALGVCESSPDSSPISVESSENSFASKELSFENS